MTKRASSMGVLLVLGWAGLAIGCPESTPSGPDGGPARRTWRVEQEHMPGAILSIWGSSPTDVYAAGGPLSTEGGSSFIAHYDGTSWQHTMPTGTTLWWIFGFSATDIWATGEKGVILHYDGSTWSTSEAPTHPYTLWGIWGAAPNDIWTVGGVAAGGALSVIRHYDGTTWTDVTGVGLMDELFFKVWGTAADDVWIVGTRGAALHWNGTAWTRTESGTAGRLLTVRGRARDDVYAVGGLGTPIVIHYDGTRWSPVAVDPLGGLMGVWTATGHGVAVSGARGILMADDGAGFTEPTDPAPTDLCLHAVWGDGTGKLYAGGGNLFSSAVPDGIVVSSTAP